jgi:hypothetical protein
VRGCHLIAAWLDDGDLDVALVMVVAGAVFVRGGHEATVSIRAVSSRLGRLAQLDISLLTWFAKLDLTSSTSTAT